MKTKLVGQIHDSLILDIPPKEIQNILEICHKVMTRDLPKHWDWICVPLEVEAEVSPINKSWFDKRQWIPDDSGIWSPK